MRGTTLTGSEGGEAIKRSKMEGAGDGDGGEDIVLEYTSK